MAFELARPLSTVALADVCDMQDTAAARHRSVCNFLAVAAAQHNPYLYITYELWSEMWPLTHV